MRATRARQGFHRPFLKQRTHGAPLRLDLGETQLGSAFASDHDEIHPVRQELRKRAEALAAEAFHAVAAYGGADAFGHHQAEAGWPGRRRLRGDEQREVGRTHPTARALGEHELAMPPQPAFHHRRVFCGRGYFL